MVFLISGQNSEDSVSLIFPDVEELLFKKGAAWGGSRLFHRVEILEKNLIRNKKVVKVN